MLQLRQSNLEGTDRRGGKGEEKKNRGRNVLAVKQKEKGGKGGTSLNRGKHAAEKGNLSNGKKGGKTRSGTQPPVQERGIDDCAEFVLF